MSTQVVVLDVNETLTDLEPLRARLVQAGAPEHLLETWFAATLRDGFALAAAGSSAPFREVAAGALQALLPDVQEDAVLDGFAALPLHADVAAGLHALNQAGPRVVTLSNGASSVAESVLERAGPLDLVEQHLSVEDTGRWKPHPNAYAYAARACGVEVEALCLVAVHPWDCDGALRAGLSAAWLDRKGATVAVRGNEVVLTVEDDGIGRSAAGERRSGRANLSTRAGQVDGQLTLGPSPRWRDGPHLVRRPPRGVNGRNP